MNVYLEEKNMPKNCVHCPFRDYEDVCILQDEEANSVANNWDDLKRGCPLISLRAQQEAEKNEPLTLDEMRKMGGKPYWHVGLRKESHPPHWNILDPFYAQHIEDYKYGENWLGYRREPEEY